MKEMKSSMGKRKSEDEKLIFVKMLIRNSIVFRKIVKNCFLL